MKHRLIVIAALCVAALEVSTHKNTYQVLRMISAERKRQDEQWGGPDHDQMHGPATWFLIIVKHVGRLATTLPRPAAQDYRDIRDAVAIIGRQVEELPL